MIMSGHHSLHIYQHFYFLVAKLPDVDVRDKAPIEVFVYI